MRRIYKLFVLCILLICQQHIVAQSYNLGKQKQSFAYETLYAYRAIINPNITNEIEKNSSPSTQQSAHNHDAVIVLQTHKYLEKKVQKAQFNWDYRYENVFFEYNYILDSFQDNLTEENIQLIAKIQSVVLNYINSETKAYPTLEKQLMNASSTEAEIAIFLSYYKE